MEDTVYYEKYVAQRDSAFVCMLAWCDELVSQVTVGRMSIANVHRP